MTTQFRHFLGKYKSKFRYYLANSVNLRQIVQLILILISLTAIVGPIVLLVFAYKKNPSVRLIIFGFLSAAIATFFSTCVALWWWRFTHPLRDDDQQVIPWSRSGSESSTISLTRDQVATGPSDAQHENLPMTPISEQPPSSMPAEANTGAPVAEENNATTPPEDWVSRLRKSVFPGSSRTKVQQGSAAA
ncbi:hypothetical protein BDP55DRAFT_683069 [Colletotrichum godetiae]|uniref:Uncharacterized protein n=1 Tax=Colletotrichum godetiae TaxID=1209918 RepID=A0AAJ0A993_9PEZI|nr:uncharacterized protein BDP55DRAFT_683069 [Colletotrichum godetiae]KAK1658349.1 hypothetical protein BDP55DRAFT_683069 [Colletotrichum godetiae]